MTVSDDQLLASLGYKQGSTLTYHLWPDFLN
jgi:hypothetical protein